MHLLLDVHLMYHGPVSSNVRLHSAAVTVDIVWITDHVEKCCYVLNGNASHDYIHQRTQVLSTISRNLVTI